MSVATLTVGKQLQRFCFICKPTEIHCWTFFFVLFFLQLIMNDYVANLQEPGVKNWDQQKTEADAE